MARPRGPGRSGAQREDYASPLRRLGVGILVVALLAVFLVWRIDSPRVERLRAEALDAIMPGFEWTTAPITWAANVGDGLRSYQRLQRQNADLRRELQQMKAWREAAYRLEQENAKLRDLNDLRLDPQLTYLTGVVLADQGGLFRQSVLVNVGARDGIVDGWAVMDGLGLVGRISGVGADTSRVILLTDTSSRIPVVIPESGQRAILGGDNTLSPPLEFLEDASRVSPGDAVVTSGDGGVFPADLQVGRVALGPDRRLRVRLSADYQRLEFLRILRSHRAEGIDEAGALIVTPAVEPPAPAPLLTPALTEALTEAAAEGDDG
ncbi:MAG: rod shape-determining protein MreC [Paracoccaceae bacterium]